LLNVRGVRRPGIKAAIEAGALEDAREVGEPEYRARSAAKRLAKHYRAAVRALQKTPE